MTQFDEYVEMQAIGVEPLDAYLAARHNSLDQVTSIRMLREVYGLSLDDAKKVSFKGDTGVEYNEQEGTLVAEFTKVLDDELGLD
ncbi:hypothetical protein GCM10007907_17720 [Chitinimonas prasina]|uniref:XRE family transcriptional regulator n=1 Tax=Chitinimonas prasina TaxID=1434937 RepID=A0ABQ5YET3_9NEIS|nr:hypothetical protein [Chitinimonas prasina]GLR12982.1 hypothetical protein GCM10007907_17720 [Chitinimonas prasina]